MASIVPPDAHKISFKIIEAIKQHPVLYINDIKGIDMKLQDFRQKVWQHIADDLGLDANWVKLRWKNLRDTYCRIVKYKNKPDKGVRRKKWIFEDNLNFLTFPFEPNYEPQTCEVTEEYIQLINSNVLSSAGLLEQLEDKNEDDYSEYLEVVQRPSTSSNAESTVQKPVETVTSQSLKLQHESDKDLIAQQIEAKFRKIRPKGEEVQFVTTSTFNTLPVTETPIVVTNPVLPAPLPKKKRKTKATEEMEIVQTISSEKRVKNSMELFFDSMAETVKKLPEDVQTNIKYDVCKVIAGAQLKSTKNKRPSKTLDPIRSLPKLLLIPCQMIDNIK